MPLRLHHINKNKVLHFKLKLLFILLIIALTWISFSCSAQSLNLTSFRQGVIRTHFILSEYNPGEDVNDYTFRIWYLDSVVVIEYAAVEFDFFIPIDKRPPAKLKTQKYVYMDVRTGMCQDYLKLDPEEKPILSYKVKPSDPFWWNFYLMDSTFLHNAVPTFHLPDTTIGGINYKRAPVENKDGKDIEKAVYYLNGNYHNLFIQLSPYFDKKNPGYKVERIDFWMNDKLFSTSYIEQLATGLSDTEMDIFKRWTENAKNSKLPVLTVQEAAKKFMEYYRTGRVN